MSHKKIPNRSRNEQKREIRDQLRRFAKKRPLNSGQQRSSPLWSAIEKGGVRDISGALAGTSNLDEPRTINGIKNVTPLMVLCRHGELEAVEALIEAGADIHRKTTGSEELYSPLMFAIQSEDVNVVSLLLKQNPDVNYIRPGKGRHSPLALAAVRGQLDICWALLERGADPHWVDHKGANIIKMAVMVDGCANAKEIVELFAEQGVSAHTPDSEGFFPIHNAADNGAAQLIETLVKLGADPNEPIQGGADDQGSRPLRRAAVSGHYYAFRKLIDLGARPELIINNQIPFDPMDDDSDEVGILLAILIHCARRTRGKFVGSETTRILTELIQLYGATPDLLALAHVLVFEKGQDARRVLFQAARSEVVNALQGDQSERFLAILLATAAEIIKEYKVRIGMVDLLERLIDLLKFDLDYGNEEMLAELNELREHLQNSAPES